MREIESIITTYFEQFRNALLADIRTVLSDCINNLEQTSVSGTIWLSPEQTRNLTGFKSRNRLKKLRESGEIHYVRIGREYRYDRKSIIDYIDQLSTKRFKIPARKIKAL